MKISSKCSPVVLLFALSLAGVALFGSRGGVLVSPAAAAQNLGERVVSGTVLNAKSEPVTGATVFLKDLKTKSIRSYASMSNGHFYFAQVKMVDDYELWAEKSGQKSAVKTVSSWDSRKEFIVDLKLK